MSGHFRVGAFTLAITLAVGLALPTTASAHFSKTADCKDLLDSCMLTAQTQPNRMSAAQCQGLYDAAVKAGGQWGLPEARAATHTTGSSRECR